ncbi:MAG: SurA N-terminal domain-containing protein [Polyangiaceae bacterium]
MRRGAIVLIGAFLMACAPGPGRAPSRDATPVSVALPTRVVARVGDRDITADALDVRLAPYAHTGQLADIGVRDRVRHDLRELMIDEMVESQFAAAMNVTVTDDDVERGVREHAKVFGLSVQELYAEARAQGLTEQAYRDVLAREMLDQKLVDRCVAPSVRVTDADLEREHQAWLARGAQVVRLRLHLVDGPIAQRTRWSARCARNALLSGRGRVAVRCATGLAQLVDTLAPELATPVRGAASGTDFDPIALSGMIFLVHAPSKRRTRCVERGASDAESLGARTKANGRAPRMA